MDNVKVNYEGQWTKDNSGHSDNEDEMVTINVGGVRFDTLR